MNITINIIYMYIMDYKNIYYISQKNLNEKSHDLPNIYFKKYFNKLDYYTYDEIINFIENNNDKNKFLILYHQDNLYMFNIYIKIINYLNNLNNININILIFNFDFWLNKGSYNYDINQIIFKAKNYKVITFASIEMLNYYHNTNFNEYKNNLIQFNTWCCYNTSYIKFNKNPINKLLLSGCICLYYPEREKILKFKNVLKLNYNIKDTENINDNYNKQLNKYLCSFASNVYFYPKNNNKLFRIELNLLKVYEILASGCLLVMPFNSEKSLKKIGIINKKHCYLIDMNNNNKLIQNEIDFILDEKNRKIIDEIRFNGQLFAINNLNSNIKFEEFKNLLNKL